MTTKLCLTDYERQSLSCRPFNRGAVPRLGRRNSPINCYRAPSNHGPGSTPPLSAHLLRRLAALSRTSLAHVTGFASSASAAFSIASFSPDESGSFIDSVRRSSGAFGGRPIRLFSIKLNIPIKSLASTLALLTNYGYDKYSQRKTLGSVSTRPRATRTGFRLIPDW